MKSVKSKNPCKSVVQTTYDIVKSHGGEIEVNSVKGERTKFTVTLPIGRITAAQLLAME